MTPYIIELVMTEKLGHVRTKNNPDKATKNARVFEPMMQGPEHCYALIQ